MVPRPPCFSLGVAFFCCCVVLFLRHVYLLEFGSKSSIVVQSNQCAFTLAVWGELLCVFAEIRVKAWVCFLSDKAWVLPRYPPFLLREAGQMKNKEIVVMHLEEIVLSRKSASLWTASLTTFTFCLLVKFSRKKTSSF